MLRAAHYFIISYSHIHDNTLLQAASQEYVSKQLQQACRLNGQYSVFKK
jgi:hypothetical protein